DEILEQVKQIDKSGCEKILLTAGDNFEMAPLDYIKQIIEKINQKYNKITLDLSIAPLSTEQCQQVSNWNIGTYHICQESYHQAAYQRMHAQGPKSDYYSRLYSIDKAIEGGIKDFGLGILLGLYDWRYEVVSLIEHAKYISNKYGIGPKAVSIPKMESQEGSILSKFPPYMVLDEQFLKIIAVLRLVLPNTEIILPTKETPEITKIACEVGVTCTLANPEKYALV
ncbi:MAG: [FeFe] hydrogenase H-cluster radical SAM maturase HydG, partial [Bacillota bacterium]|nr:[FeFe] hydrogenase H-cluster radical SAM maturase HydG [Bacillota bacterium]